MLRDDYTKKIQETLDAMYNDPDSKSKYDMIMRVANNSMNVQIEANKNGKHSVSWFNRKVDGCYDDNLEQLVYIIENIKT